MVEVVEVVAAEDDAVTVSPLYPHCILTVSLLYPSKERRREGLETGGEMRKRRRKMRKNASIKYMRVCPVCQRPNVINLSSHLSMVHGLNGHERTPHLKNAVLCSTTTTPPAVQTLRKKAEKAIILQINDKPGPLLVHLNQIQWSMVNETFRESSCGGNFPEILHIDASRSVFVR